MINVRGKEVKNQFDELTVKEFETISNILKNNNLDYIDKYLTIFEIIGLGEETDNITTDELVDLIKQLEFSTIENVFTKEVEINGFKYVAYSGDEFKMLAKDFSLIENWVNNNDNYMARVLAIIFKREDLSKIEHYTEAHLKLKTTLFENLLIKDYISYMLYIDNSVIKKFKAINEIA